MLEKPSDNDTYRLDVSALLDLHLPHECIAGIEVNCELLRIHARKVEAFLVPDESEEPESEEPDADEVDAR